MTLEDFLEEEGFEKLKREIEESLIEKPEYIRKGQFIFNYMDREYGCARVVQFQDGIDCFYDDRNIDSFIKCCYERMREFADGLINKKERDS